VVVHLEVSVNWWNELLSPEGKELTLKIVKSLKELSQTVDVFPDPDQLFRCLDLVKTPKVVILGQDPYPTPGHANGLAFAVNPDCPLPKSLINIFKELEADIPESTQDRTLLPWVQQGVILLNTTLTVESGKAGSHRNLGWDKVTNEIIFNLSSNYHHLVFILWGNHAQEKKPLIDTTKHLILTSPHPSPLSAARGFFGSKPFSKTNDYLIAHQSTPIQW